MKAEGIQYFKVFKNGCELNLIAHPGSNVIKSYIDVTYTDHITGYAEHRRYIKHEDWR